MKRSITLVDTTLRDGSHAVAHRFTLEQIADITRGLSQSGCKVIECGHGDGLQGSSIQYGFSACDETDIIRTVCENAGDATVGVLLIPGIGTIEGLEKVRGLGVGLVRVATHVTEADTGAEHIRHAKDVGMKAFGFLMMSHMSPPEAILLEAKKFESYGADAVYLADSAGAMAPRDVTARISLLTKELGIPVGFHAHNNLGLAIGNSLAAVEAGARYTDATLRGLGAGAGNAPHEALAAVLDKVGIETGESLYGLMDAAEAYVAPLAQMVIDKYALTIGYAGVYSSFFLHAKRAAERYGLDARDILMELGRMKTVGGQEDMIIDVAHRLSQERKQNP
ncbi:MAG: 4-hydroxy-2-oxovalerate aldolase [Candidatus Limiplasma sp.]|nr:4-hydroxy-2-oxovalerate aldolase [Candidatus Limiplasma sp.]